MPRRCSCHAANATRLLAFPTTEDELIRHYTLSETGPVGRSASGAATTTGSASPCSSATCATPAVPWATDAATPHVLCWTWSARQLHIAPECWSQYARADRRPGANTCWSCKPWLRLTPFAVRHYRRRVHQLCTTWPGRPTRASCWPTRWCELLRQQRIMLPAIEVIERICAEALTRGTRQRLRRR